MSNDKEYWVGVEMAARKRLQSARSRLEHIDAERDALVAEIMQLEQLVQSVVPLTADQALPQTTNLARTITFAPGLGLADACRATLQMNDRYMIPIEIRDVLLSSNFDLSTYTNPLASIHAVLKRLVESGEAEQWEVGGKTFYRWKANQGIVNVSSRFILSEGPLTLRTLPNQGSVGVNPVGPPHPIPTREDIAEAQKKSQSERKRADVRAIMEGGKTSTKTAEEKARKKSRYRVKPRVPEKKD